MNLDEIIIRKSVLSELPILAEFRWSLCCDDAEVKQPIDKDVFTENFICKMTKLDATGNLINFIAEQRGVLKGVISLILVNKIPSPDNITDCWGYVTNVYVKPECRNRRIGEKLLDFVKDFASENGCELLTVWPSNLSYSFYKRSGFKSEGREQDPLVLVF